MTVRTAWSRVLELTDVDPRGGHPVPAASRLLLAVLAASAGSLLADAALVAVGRAVFPATRGYEHFRVGDYAPLTVLGVIAACIGWPVVAWLSTAPRRLLGRLAIVTTLVLLAPDVAILVQGQPPRAVLVLVLMHLAIGAITYAALVTVAPPTRPCRLRGPRNG